MYLRGFVWTAVSTLTHVVGFEQADKVGFWDQSIRDMKDKMSLFNQIWHELDLPYSDPEGGYFVLVNMAKVRIPKDFSFPEAVLARPRDFQLAWWLIHEFGVAAIPPTEFYTEANASLAQDYLRFAVCKPDAVLEDAKRRLRGLRRYIQ